MSGDDSLERALDRIAHKVIGTLSMPSVEQTLRIFCTKSR